MFKPLKYHALAEKCYSMSACCKNIFKDSQESFSYIFNTLYITVPWLLKIYFEKNCLYIFYHIQQIKT
jgi:hypothetical protein